MNAITKSITAGGFAAAAGLAAAVVGLAGPASAASTGSADSQIAQLEAQGNRVIVNRLSDVALGDADIVTINKGADIRSTVLDASGDDTRQQVVTGSVYYVDVR